MKTSTKWKKIVCVALGLCIAGLCVACGQGETDMDKDEQDKTEQETATWDTQTEGTVITRPQIADASVKELLGDLNFSQGFKVTLFHSNSSNGQIAGTLDHGGDAASGDPIWTLAQWGCTHNMAEATFTRDGSVLTYEDGGKKLSFDVTETGSVTLGIKGSTEYTLDEDGNIRERTDATENWPHILIEQSIGHDISAEAEHLYMEVEYRVTACESLVDREIYPEDPELNAAQFQWFITLTDTDEASESYGQSMWFGFSMFDTRALGGTPSGLASYDGGKEDSTGLFIYMPSLTQVAANAEATDSEVTVPTAVIGENRKVKIDILPWLSQALKTARQYGALTGASVEHLRIGSTNIGWELPGNYDAEVVISYLNIYEVF